MQRNRYGCIMLGVTRNHMYSSHTSVLHMEDKGESYVQKLLLLYYIT